MLLSIVMFYLLTWFFLMLLGGLQQATGLLPPEIGLPQWGPGIAALLMLLIFRKDEYKINFFDKKIPAMRYLAAALIPVGVGLVVLLIRSIIPIANTSTTTMYNSLLLMIVWIPLGALGEELGWRGYLHKKLGTRLRGLYSSLLVGILWMPIHVSFFAQGPVFIFFLALLIISYSVVIFALVQDMAFNVLLATIFHVFINLTNLLFLDVIHETSFMMVNSIVWVIVAVITIIIKKDIFLKPKE